MTQNNAEMKLFENEIDALTLLSDDHEEVKALFEDYFKLPEDEDSLDIKRDLVQQICEGLIIHSQIEEDYFYPAVRAAIEDDELIDEAEAEHAEVRDLISQLELMSPIDENYDAEVSNLAKTVMHHIRQEEEDIFTQVQETNMDLLALGEKMNQLKADLQAEMDMPDFEDIDKE